MILILFVGRFGSSIGQLSGFWRGFVGLVGRLAFVCGANRTFCWIVLYHCYS